MEKIDSHHHLWRYRPAEYGWITDRMSILKRDFVPQDLERSVAECGISGTVAVQARQSLEETWSLLRWADQSSVIRGVVGWVPLLDPDLNRLLPTLAEHPKLCGVRHVLHDEPDDFYMLRDDFNRGVSLLKPHGVVYDILIYERHLPQTIEFVDRHPGQVFVLDHIAKPRIREGALSPWRENLRELSRRENVYCKLSGMVTEADWRKWSLAALAPYFDVVVECFGPQRIMFGSDWPVCLVATQYCQWVESVTSLIERLSPAEQEWVWAGTANRAYSLPI